MRYGDIIELGRHKLMCGDSVKDISALMSGYHAKIVFTSPPYFDIRDYEGCNLSPEYLSQFIPACKDFAEVQCVNLGIKRRSHEVITYWDTYIARAREAGLKLLSWNVWDKMNPGSISMQQAMFPIRHEFVFVFGEKPFSLNRSISKRGRDRNDYRNKRKVREKDGTIRVTTGNVNPSEPNKRLETVIQCHPEKSNRNRKYGVAVMPLKIAEEYIKACTQPDDIVLDPFGGAGTTLIACERTGRRCFIMEISPEYCGAIIQRYEDTRGMASP